MMIKNTFLSSTNETVCGSFRCILICSWLVTSAPHSPACPSQLKPARWFSAPRLIFEVELWACFLHNTALLLFLLLLLLTRQTFRTATNYNVCLITPATKKRKEKKERKPHDMLDLKGSCGAARMSDTVPLSLRCGLGVKDKRGDSCVKTSWVRNGAVNLQLVVSFVRSVSASLSGNQRKKLLGRNGIKSDGTLIPL